MAGIKLYDYQTDALNKMHNGCILCGGVGSGKSRTALGYYYVLHGGEINTEEYVPMDDLIVKDLYIITTARKRDTREWEAELAPFLLNPFRSELYNTAVIIDSWNNIHKYEDVKDAFFIFDEQRVVGKGAWVKSFLKIAKANQWILLSATPGDTWEDYIPVFVANGFYKNRSEFIRQHIIYKRFSKFPQIDRYVNTGRLIRLRDRILVDMDFSRQTVSHHNDIYCAYDVKEYKRLMRERFDIEKGKPFQSAGELCYALRKCVNSDKERVNKLKEILDEKKKVIIFYNYDYELECIRILLESIGRPYSEWNGHKHQEIPEKGPWAYLVQYTAGAEGWNCITTDTIIFYSQTYSYKQLQQACGRIDRLNTPYHDLYYYHLKSRAPIDIGISRALANKKNFNEGRFICS